MREVSVLVRSKEYEVLNNGKNYPNPEKFRFGGKNDDVPMWYFDPATNSLLNGAVNTNDTVATSILWDEFKKLVIEGVEIVK